MAHQQEPISKESKNFQWVLFSYKSDVNETF